MQNHKSRFIFANTRSMAVSVGLAAIFCAVNGYAERAESVIYQPAIQKNFRPVQQVATFVGNAKNTFEINLARVNTPALPDKKEVFASGFVHSLSTPIKAPQLTWQRINERSVARVRVITHQAKALRLHFAFIPSHEIIEFRLQGNQDARAIVVASSGANSGEIWLPVTRGNQVELEIVISGQQSGKFLEAVLDQVNLVINESNVKKSSLFAPRLKGDAREVEFDLACWEGCADYSALQQAAAATALIDYIEDGRSYICSGTLLTDRGQTLTPWFATAHHCIGSQKVASTASFSWFYQAQQCGSAITHDNFQVTDGGAQLLWSNAKYDFSLLKLNKPPAPGVVFSGWDDGNPRTGDNVYGVHHPEGDHTMVSKGRVFRLLETINDSGLLLELDNIQFSKGGTEVGSSGSGLFAVSGHAYWKGTLWGGSVLDYQDADYSPFRKYAANIKPWLNSCALPWGGSIKEGVSVQAYQDKTSADCNLIMETRVCEKGVLKGSFGQQSCALSTSVNCKMPDGTEVGEGKDITAYLAISSTNCDAVSEVRTCNDGSLSGSYEHSFCSTHDKDLILFSPNGNDRLVRLVNRPVDILWDFASDNSVAYHAKKVNIAISKNSGKKWVNLKTGAKNTGQWRWKPGKKWLSNHARIRVCIPGSKKSLAICDISDFDFEIRKK